MELKLINYSYKESILNIEIKTGTLLGITGTNKKEILVMEVNGSVCMNRFAEIIPNGYEIAKSVYAKAVDKMFES